MRMDAVPIDVGMVQRAEVGEEQRIFPALECRMEPRHPKISRFDGRQVNVRSHCAVGGHTPNQHFLAFRDGALQRLFNAPEVQQETGIVTEVGRVDMQISGVWRDHLVRGIRWHRRLFHVEGFHTPVAVFLPSGGFGRGNGLLDLGTHLVVIIHQRGMLVGCATIHIAFALFPIFGKVQQALDLLVAQVVGSIQRHIPGIITIRA